MAVPSFAKYIPLVLAILADLIMFLQQNPNAFPGSAILTTIAVLIYAILHDLEPPVSLPGTNQAQKV